MRESFVFYASWMKAIGNLPREIRGDVLTAIVEYGLYGETTETPKSITAALLEMVKPQIDINNVRYENGCKGADYGKLGGRPKVGEKPQRNPKETPSKPLKNPKQTPNEYVYDNVNDIKEKNTPNGVFEKKGELSFPAPAPESNSVSGQISESHPEPLSPPPSAEEKEKSSAKKEKERYAEFVTMTNAEYQALMEKYGQQQTREMIEILDNYKGSSGKKYKSDYRAILNWVIDRYNEKHKNHGQGTTDIKELNDRKYGSTDPIKQRIMEDIERYNREWVAKQVQNPGGSD